MSKSVICIINHDANVTFLSRFLFKHYQSSVCDSLKNWVHLNVQQSCIFKMTNIIHQVVNEFVQHILRQVQSVGNSVGCSPQIFEHARCELAI